MILLNMGYIRNILQLGSNWNNGSKAGLFYSNLNNDVGNSNRNNGSQLELRILFWGEGILRTANISSPIPGETHCKHTRVRLVPFVESLARILLPIQVIQ